MLGWCLSGGMLSCNHSGVSAVQDRSAGRGSSCSKAGAPAAALPLCCTALAAVLTASQQSGRSTEDWQQHLLITHAAQASALSLFAPRMHESILQVHLDRYRLTHATFPLCSALLLRARPHACVQAAAEEAARELKEDLHRTKADLKKARAQVQKLTKQQHHLDDSCWSGPAAAEVSSAFQSKCSRHLHLCIVCSCFEQRNLLEWSKHILARQQLVK